MEVFSFLMLWLPNFAIQMHLRRWHPGPPTCLNGLTCVLHRSLPEKLERLDEGERAAILLAEAQQSPVLLLMDDSDGRAEAERRHIPVTGTLGIIRAAALRDLIDLPTTLKNLVGTNFRCPAELINELLSEDAERKRAR